MVRATHPHPRNPASARSRFALVNWRVRWRLAAVIAVPTLTAAVLGALTIYGDVSNWQATGRVQHLAQLNADTIKLSQALEDELNVSAAYAATRPNNGALAGPLKQAQNVTDSAASAVVNDSSGVTLAAGYQPGTVQDLNAVLASINDLANDRQGVIGTVAVPRARRSSGSSARTSSRPRTRSAPPSEPAPTTRPCRATSPRWAPCCGTRTRCRCSGPSSTRRSSPRRGRCRSEDLTILQQASEQAKADLADFNASSDTAEQQNYSNTVSGAEVDVASSNEILAEQMATSEPSVPLTNSAQLDPGPGTQDMTTTIQRHARRWPTS